MAVEIEGLEFKVEAKTEKCQKELTKLSQTLERLKTVTKGFSKVGESTTQIQKLNNALGGLKNENLKKLGKSFDALSKANSVKISATIPKRITEIGAALKKLNWADIDKMESFSRALQGLKGSNDIRIPTAKTLSNVTAFNSKKSGKSHQNSELQDAEDSVKSIREAFAKLRKEVSDVKGMLGLTAIAKSLSELPSKITKLIGKLAVMTSKFKKSGGILGVFGRTVKAVATSLSSKLAGGVKQVTSSLGNRFTSKVHSATSALGSFLSSIKRIALYRMIRFALSQLTQCLQEGINNLYNYSSLMGGTFANSMNSLATNAQYLKNSMGAMAAPIINALAPAIDFVIDKVVHLFNVLNQLFARLTGSKTYTAAKKISTAYGDAAKDAGSTAAKEAKKAADEIKRYTLGFDELNILGDNNKDSDSSGGNGGTSNGSSSLPDYGSMFEELPIDNAISNFADALKAAFDAGDWKELGSILGNKFNEIVDSIDWSGFGKKVGYGINGAVQTAYWFLKTADFVNLGNHVAEFLNSALSEIDFTFVGRLLVRRITAGLDFLVGALGGLDWQLVGTSFGNLLRGAFSELQEWIAGIDWSSAAHALWQNTKDCIAGIDFTSLAQSFFNLLGTALSAAVSLVATFVSDVWKDITGYFQQYLVNDDGTRKTGIDWVKGICKGIVDGVASIGTWILDNVCKPFIDGFKSAFGIHSPSTVMAEQGKYLVDGLLLGIKNAIGSVIDFIGDFLAKIKKKMSDAWDSIKTTASEKWGEIKTTLSNAWDSIKTTSSTVWNKITTTISDTWGKIKTKSSEVWLGIKTTISTKWNEIKTNTSTIWQNVKTSLSTTWQNVKTTAGTTWTNIKTSIGTAWTNVKTNTATIWSNIKTSLNTTWQNVKTNAGTIWNGMKTTMATTWQNVKTTASTVWSGIKTSLGTTWSSLKTTASTTWFGIKNAIATKWESIKVNTSTIWSTLTTDLKGVWEGIKTTASDTFQGIKDGISEKIEGAKTVVSEGIEKLKSFFNFSWSLPSIKLPHFSITGNFSLNPPSIPHFGVSWYKTGGILDGAQIFGMMGNTMLGGGEAGREAVLPLETHTEWMDTLAQKVRQSADGNSRESIADGVREGTYDATARQNELIKELITEVRRIGDKEFTTEISTSSIIGALEHRNRRDGRTMVPVTR